MEVNPENVTAINDESRENYTSDDNHEFVERKLESQSELSGDGSDVSNRSIELSSSVHHIKKWQRLRRQFNDQYLELFNDVSNNHLAAKDEHGLLDSQYGAVSWTSEEKDGLFTAMERIGRHDLSRLSSAVYPKSPLEVRAYLDTVHAAHIDRQLFMAQPKNISRADIPAAIEIGHECEIAAEGAADALSAYQEQYDITAGQNQHGQSWLVDRETAAQIDQESDKIQPLSDNDVETSIWYTEEQSAITPEPSRRYFKISNMLDLSEQFFMNQPPESPNLHWKSVAEPKQRPALTQDTLDTMLQLVTDRLRKILKIALHVANARLSSMTNGGYAPTQSLNRSDVATALDILNYSHDPWGFWTNLARRNQFEVITGSHSKGESREKIISYDSAEAALATRRNQKRRRSMSIGSETSSLQSNASEDIGTLSGFEDAAADGSFQEPSEIEDDSVTSDDQDDTGSTEESRSSSPATSNLLEATEAYVSVSLVGREGRRVILDEQLEDHVEEIDRVAQREEERRLWQILGKRPNADIEDDYKLGPRPKTMRKTKEELDDWSCVYMAKWEQSVGLGLLSAETQSEEADVEDNVGSK